MPQLPTGSQLPRPVGAASAEQRGGEFTQMFGAVTGAQKIQPAPLQVAPTPQQQEITGGMGATAQFAAPGAPPPAPVNMPPPGIIAAPPPPGASYTTMFSAPSSLTLGQTPQAKPGLAPIAAPVKKFDGKLPLIIAGIGVFLLVLFLILFLVSMNRK
jgi:hypothetical protein